MKNICLFSLLLFIAASAQAQTFEEVLKDAEYALLHGQNEKAHKLFNKAVKLNPKSAAAYYGRGASVQRENILLGKDDFLKAVELDSLHEGSLHCLATHYLFKGEYELADDYTRKAIALNMEDANNQLLMAQIYRKEGNLEKALELCNQSINQHEECCEWLATVERAELKFEMKDYEGSVIDFEKCFTEFLAGMYSAHQFEMCGDAYKILGNMKKACIYWYRAINDPDVMEPSESAMGKVVGECE